MSAHGYEVVTGVTRGARGGMVVTVRVKDPATKNTSSYALTTNEQRLAANKATAEKYAVRHLKIINGEDPS